jgi:hypothetical protein
MSKRTKTIIFSKDRPMQCLATIESFYKYCFDVDLIDIDVLFFASNKKISEAYHIVEDNVSSGIIFVEQKNFKENLLHIVEGYDYTFFVVDDNLFVRNFCVDDGQKFLEKWSDAIVFSYRMGLNINYCYTMDRPQEIRFFHVFNNQIKTCWETSVLDWNYPMDLSSSIYRTGEIYPYLKYLEYSNPNQLEFYLDNFKSRFYKPYMGCYQQSVAFCNPINKVNSINTNRSGDKNEYSIENLLKKFQDGYRINIDKFDGFIPNSPHQEVEIEFIK